MVTRFTGWLLGLDRVVTTDLIRLELGARWAAQGSNPFWICLAVLVLVGGALLFYFKFQPVQSRRARVGLATLRSLLLLSLLLTLLQPLLRISVTRWQPPELYLVFDGTASMTIRDSYDADTASALSTATGLPVSPGDPACSRLELVQTWLSNRAGSPHTDNTVLQRLHAQSDCRIRAFLFDGQSTSRLRELGTTDIDNEEPVADGPSIARQLTATGQVTALGDVLSDIGRQPGRRHVAAVVLVSDFVQNSGTHPLAGNVPKRNPLRALGVPVHTVSVGAPAGRDVAIAMEPEPRVRRGEEVLLHVRLRQTQLSGQTVSLRVEAIPQASAAAMSAVEIASRNVTLDAADMYLDIPYVPAQAGQLDLVAEVTPVPGEAVRENNRATQRIEVIEDFVRVLYVAHEPTWEWRFIKEVLHRDAAVGLQGFRTYLASSDPRVRQANPLFLPTLAQPPQAFYANDVVFLDDFPGAALTPHFCSMLEHFVGEFGGGLVVIAGPRFGPQQLAATPLAAMLPVILDPQARLQDSTEFAVQLTPQAAQYRFMQLEDDPQQNRRAWARLSHLAWYQPVANQHEQATVLAQHPLHTCQDGSTPQPLIAIRRYGAGEVLYVAFNETWRLRRLDGERHYRRFWLPVIDRLGLSHALGPQKRFVVRTDRVQYRLGDDVHVTIHACDAEYQPLSSEQLEGQSLSGDLVRLAVSQEDELLQPLRFGQQRSGVYGTQLPAVSAGSYVLSVQDPVTGQRVQQSFEVLGGSTEMLAATRDDDLARRMAAESGGTFRSLQNIQTLPDQIDLPPILEGSQHVFPLWNTPIWFIWIVSLMFGEWLLRKWVNLV